MKMVPYEAFAFCCGAEDVVLGESYEPKTREERVRLLVNSPGASTTPSYSSRPSTPPSYSPGPSTPPSYSLGPSRNAECSNCKLLLKKIKVLEATIEMYMHPEQHALNSTTLLHEVYNDMGKLGLESIDEDFRVAGVINKLCEEVIAADEEKGYFIQELDDVFGWVIATQKAFEFLK
ncbi:hypothetical protein Tco_1358200 [Tanacetum coccineum]